MTQDLGFQRQDKYKRNTLNLIEVQLRFFSHKKTLKEKMPVELVTLDQRQQRD